MVAREMRVYAQHNQWKPSWTFYGKWGKGPKVALRFSRSGDRNIEQAYATHYVGPKPEKQVQVKTENEPGSNVAPTAKELLIDSKQLNF